MPATKIAIFDEAEGFIKQFVSLTRKTRDYIGCDGSLRTFPPDHLKNPFESILVHRATH